MLSSTPAVAATSTDAQVRRLVDLVNEEGLELAARHTWQGIRKECSFSTVGVPGGILSFKNLVGGSGYASGFNNTYNLVPLTGGSGTGALATITVAGGIVTSVVITFNTFGQGYAVNDVLSASAANLGGSGSGFSIQVATIGIVSTESQGDIRTLTGPDFNFIVNETMWNRTQRRPVFGPKSPAEWQQLKAQFMQGPWIQYMLRGYQLFFLPIPSPGFAIFFEWMSNYWAQSAQGAGQNYMLADTDTANLDERLITLGAIWRYKMAVGFDYSEDQDKYEAAVQDAIGRDGSKARLNLAGAQSDIYPGVVVPAGSWPLAGSK